VLVELSAEVWPFILVVLGGSVLFSAVEAAIRVVVVVSVGIRIDATKKSINYRDEKLRMSR
jgi:general stress protein CsbA